MPSEAFLALASVISLRSHIFCETEKNFPGGLKLDLSCRFEMFAQCKVGALHGIILSRHFPFSITKLIFISVVYGQGLSGSGLSHFSDNYVYPLGLLKAT